MNKATSDSKAWLSGVVRRFDEKTGEGMVQDQTGTSYYVHYSAIQSQDDWKTLRAKKKVKFKLVKDTTFAQVSHIKEI